MFWDVGNVKPTGERVVVESISPVGYFIEISEIQKADNFTNRILLVNSNNPTRYNMQYDHVRF